MMFSFRSAAFLFACAAVTGCQGAPSQEPLAAEPLAAEPLAAEPLAAEPLAPDVLRLWLEADPERFGVVLSRADELRLKIELAVVVDGEQGPATLERSRFDAGPLYFYPASAIKTCAAVAAALRFRKIEAETETALPKGLETPLRFLPLFAGEVVEDSDQTHLDGGTLTLAHAMRKVFLVSDNVAFNHLYEFAGNRYLNDAMRAAGLASTRILHRLSEFRSPSEHLRTPRIELLSDGHPVAWIPEASAGISETHAGMSGVKVGRGYESGGAFHSQPMSFEQKNYMSLRDLQDMQVMLLRPDVRIPGAARAGFALDPRDRALMAEAMAGTPGASRDPVYDRDAYPDHYSKFLAPGAWRVLSPERLTICDKVGRAYGFSTTNSLVRDEVTGRSFFLAATIYTNPNGTLNDDDYDYGMADQFFEDLGETVTRRLFAD